MRDGAAADGLHMQLCGTVPVPLDLDLRCAPGQVLALVGASGAGKTTVLRCIAGLHRPEAGLVRCAGWTWLDTAAGVDLAPHRRAAGLVFQDYALFPHMTALANVAAGMGHLPRQDRTARARGLLSLVRLDGMEGRRPAELSGGQQQRVALARALARDPDVLLLDEPFSAVDRPTRRALQADLANLRQQLAIPVVLVTHDLDDTLLLADAVAVLDAGQVLQHGPPGEVARHPASARVAWLLGTEAPNPMLPATSSSWPSGSGPEPPRAGVTAFTGATAPHLEGRTHDEAERAQPDQGPGHGHSERPDHGPRPHRHRQRRYGPCLDHQRGH